MAPSAVARPAPGDPLRRVVDLAHDAPLPIPPEQLAAIGCTAVRARTRFPAEDIAPLLAALRDEDCVHSWRSALVGWDGTDPAACVEALRGRAEALRPTVLFAYTAERPSGATETVAFATLSDGVRRAFRYPGFPVLARCYIRPDWRGRGLYRHLLDHRVALARAAWGDDLRALHLGTADPGVVEVVRRPGLQPGFVRIGTEVLPLPGVDREVHDFLAPMPRFVAAVCADPRLDATGRGQLRALLTEGTVPWWVARAALAAAIARGAAESDDAEALLALGDAIGLDHGGATR